MMDNLPLTLMAFQRQYVNSDEEHALLFDMYHNLIVERTGDNDSVHFTQYELNRACGGMLVHSHPNGKPFSGEDLALAARNALTIQAFGTTPDGETWVYEARMPAPSEPMAVYIESKFDALVNGYSNALADSGLNPDKLEREARNFAITDLSKVLHFAYGRQQILPTSTISEMTNKQSSYEVKRLDNLANVETTMRDNVLGPLSASIIKLLVANSNGAGVIPIERLDGIRQQVYALVTGVILGKPRPDGTLHPYTTSRGHITPNSPYFTAMWNLMHTAAALAIQQHADIMRKYLPSDLLHSFEYAQLNPYSGSVSELQSDEPKFDPLHLWVGTDGKRLVDRIWNVAGDLFRRIDTYITQAVQQGKSVQQITSELDASLVPGQETAQVLDEVGSLKFETMRLIRTEVNTIANRAGWAAAQKNPYVGTYSPYLSPRHRCCDECDDQVRGGPYDKRDVEHLPSYHSHCMCGVIWNETDEPDAITLSLRQQIAQAISGAKASISDYIGPLSRKFLGLLFGEQS